MCWVLAGAACGEITCRARYPRWGVGVSVGWRDQVFVMRSLLQRDRLDINSVYKDKSPAFSCRALHFTALRSMGALVGIAQGLACDEHLNDNEVSFLHQWLEANRNIALTWPGDVVYVRIKQVLADGYIPPAEAEANY